MPATNSDMVWLLRERDGDPVPGYETIRVMRGHGSTYLHETDLAVLIGQARAWKTVFPCCEDPDCLDAAALDRLQSLLSDTAYERQDDVCRDELHAALKEAEEARAVPTAQ